MYSIWCPIIRTEMGKAYSLLPRGQRRASNYMRVQVMIQGALEAPEGGLGPMISRDLSIICPRGILSEPHVLGSLPKLMLCINGRSSPCHPCHSNAEHPIFSQGSSCSKLLAMGPQETLECPNDAQAAPHPYAVLLCWLPTQ